MTRNLTAGRAAGLGAAAVVARLAARYAVGVARADRAGPAQVERRLSDLGDVDAVSILPLVERLTAGDSRLAGEPGVSYLIRAGGSRVLFDCGLSGGKEPSALARNATELRVDLTGLDAVVISHLHLDHVSGVRAMRDRTFTFSRQPREPRGVPAHVPTPMQHRSADVIRPRRHESSHRGWPYCRRCRACCSGPGTSPSGLR